MKVTFYHSPLCPRCLAAKKQLYSLQQQFNLEIEEVDVVLQFKRAHTDKIKLFPAIHACNRKLSGVILSRKKIVNFLQTINIS